MNQNKGSLGLFVAIMIGFTLLIGSFLVAKAIYQHDGPSAATIIDGASSDSPTVDHFLTVDGIFIASSTILGKMTTRGVLATTSTGSATGFNAASITNYRTIVLTPNVAASTVTLPASSTLSAFVPNAGDRASILLFNGTSTSAAILTLSGATGTILSSASSTKLVLAGKAVILDFMRSATSTDIYVYMTGSGN